MAIQCKRKPFKSVEYARTAIYAMNARKAPQAKSKLFPKWCPNCRALHIQSEVK